MATHKIELNNKDVVFLNTDVTLATIKRFRNNGLLSKNFLGKLVVLESNPKDFEMDDMENAVYLAYCNAKNKVNYSQEEFEELLPYDIAYSGLILSEICSGETKKHDLQKKFTEKTKKNNKGKNVGKKIPK